MKKTTFFKSLVFLFLLLSSTNHFSQVTIYNADFSNSTGVNNWAFSSNNITNGEWTNGNDATYATGATGNYIYSKRYTTQYNNNTSITATSPTISSIGYSTLNLSVKVRYDTESGNDGINIQYSLNDGSTWSVLGTESNGFYNDTDVDGIANNTDGWSGNSSGWTTKTINLTNISTAFNNNANLKFRINFGSNNSIQGVGVAFDNIVVTGILDTPEIDVKGNNVSIPSGSTTTSVTNHTLFSETDAVSTSISTRTFTISNSANVNLNLTGNPKIVLSNPTNFTVTTADASIISPITSGGSTSFIIQFSSITAGTFTSTVTISNNDSDEGSYTFTISGTAIAALAYAPGGVNGDLKVWLRSDIGAGSTNGQSVTSWGNQGRHNNPTAISGREPKYRDDAAYNINFNPVIDFNNATNGGLDASFSASGQQYMSATDGFYTQDIFLVVIPDMTVSSTAGTMDLFCGNDPAHQPTAEDVTGIGFGAYTSSLSNEVVTYAQNVNSSYRIADNTASRTYSSAGIINARNNTNIPATGMQLYFNGTDISTIEINTSSFYNLSNTNYWIGRSETWTANTNARIAEIVNYSSRKNDATERPKIETYLALKYGITLGANGISQDYINSDATVVFAGASGYNHNLAGIGRDDVSKLLQKQSKSINDTNDITIGLGTIATTNSSNPNTFTNNKDYLVWGNNNGSLLPQTPIVANISSGVSALTSEVTFVPIGRVWKLVESGINVPSVKISIPTAMLSATLAPPGEYLMFISDSPTFTSTADYRIMKVNSTNLEVDYDFNGTKYITFGYASQKTFDRSIDFDGTNDYLDAGNVLDLNNNFTVSAWIKRSGTNQSILSKRNNTHTIGYDLKINGSGLLEMSWMNGTMQAIQSSVIIPSEKWYNVAVTFEGTTAKLYIDGVLDTTQNLLAIPTNTESFLIAAADGNNPTSFFNGTIDEVRLWNIALSEMQLRYIMNQEIIKYIDNNVSGKIIPQNITLNETGTIPWSSLKAYFPMSDFVFTNTKDASDNNYIAVLKNLNTVTYQTAPLPYNSIANGDWTSTETWENNTVQNFPYSVSIIDDFTTIDWNIVAVNHTINSYGNKKVLGMSINNAVLNIDNDSKIEVSHYLKLNGKIDLKGRSQLIQSFGSDLDTSSNGHIERDQQGTKNIYNYNYWCSPVGGINVTANNTSYTLANSFKDGTDPDAYLDINWIGGYNGVESSPISLASYWLFTFPNYSNQPSNWISINPYTQISTATGFTLKGSGTSQDYQNYIFVGKPNNGEITIPVNSGNLNLTGNPYPSALDSETFITENIANGSITGALYFWEHFETNFTHVLTNYQGGYAALTAVGGTPPVSPAGISGLGTSNRIPSRFIPVGQGFFVTGSETGGLITFNNNQRLFVKEDNTESNIMFRSANEIYNEYNNEDDTYGDGTLLTKIRLGFNSHNNYHRQLLLGFMNGNASSDIDPGYDAVSIDNFPDDMLFLHGDTKLVIQADGFFNNFNVYPLSVKTSMRGYIDFVLDDFENLAEDQQVYIYDAETNLYHNIKIENFEILVPAGLYNNRFFLCFRTDVMLGTIENEFKNELEVIFTSDNNTLKIINEDINTQIESITLFNVLGQNLKVWKMENESQRLIEIPMQQYMQGTYIIKLKTSSGTISKKIIIE